MSAASLYARGDYFAAHEAWEDEWRATRSPRLRGLCQLAAAAVQAQRGKWRGVRTLTARAAANLGGDLGDEVRAWGERVANAEAWEAPPAVT